MCCLPCGRCDPLQIPPVVSYKRLQCITIKQNIEMLVIKSEITLISAIENSKILHNVIMLDITVTNN